VVRNEASSPEANTATKRSLPVTGPPPAALPASCILYCFTRQVKGAADYIPAEDRKSLPLRAANRGDDPLHREVERVAMAPDTTPARL
jgi:hypothetical protein